MKKFVKAVGRMAVATLTTTIILELLRKCRKPAEAIRPESVVDRTIIKYIPNQVIIWKRPEVSLQQFELWKKKYRPRGVKEIRRCEFCDDTLILWEGENVSTFISGKGASDGVATSSEVMGGGDAVAYYSFNFIIDLPESASCVKDNTSKGREFPDQSAYKDPVITIAVFDTGLDPAIKARYTSKVPSCIPGGELGWNFVGNMADTTDDHLPMHGTTVTKFIIDQATKYKNRKINILPVKVHDHLGKGDLLGILCGLAYAANCGAKIINASFGFYSFKGLKAPAILTDFVARHLTSKNILLVSAAGNVCEDKSFWPAHLVGDIRNLDMNPFFPACLAKNMDNVLAVTTTSVTKDDVSPTQNYSNDIVDLGVQCDRELAGDYMFEDSLQRVDAAGNQHYLVGSSFATPIITGTIAQFYDAVTNAVVAGKINKAKIISNLLSTPGVPISVEGAPLKQFVVDGNCCEK